MIEHMYTKNSQLSLFYQCSEYKNACDNGIHGMYNCVVMTSMVNVGGTTGGGNPTDRAGWEGEYNMQLP